MRQILERLGIMSVISRIQQNYDNLTKTEQLIANYIVGHYSEIAFQTLGDLAESIEVSTTSVIRFARAIGYAGFTPMQESIQRGLVKKMTLPERYDENYSSLKKGGVLQDLLNAEINNLQRTTELIDKKALQKAVKAINAAHTIYLLGARGTFGLAHTMMSNLSQIKEHVHLVSGVGGIYPEEIVGAKKGDVCIAYLFPRYQKMMSSLLAWMKSRGVIIILITTDSYNSIKHLGDIFLTCSLQSGIMTKDSMIPPMFVSNYLFACVMAENYEETRAKLEDMEDILDKGFYFGV